MGTARHTRQKPREGRRKRTIHADARPAPSRNENQNAFAPRASIAPAGAPSCSCAHRSYGSRRGLRVRLIEIGIEMGTCRTMMGAHPRRNVVTRAGGVLEPRQRRLKIAHGSRHGYSAPYTPIAPGGAPEAHIPTDARPAPPPHQHLLPRFHRPCRGSIVFLRPSSPRLTPWAIIDRRYRGERILLRVRLIEIEMGTCRTLMGAQARRSHPWYVFLAAPPRQVDLVVRPF